ncbi:hypothetical protein [Dyadobacter aurulentus]|uniref:hypothetical protein n=1 Tax=Dyadobacter sp. UC 10 TaxID=2605428 RepID=UPI0011F1A5B6|nr:hypothetical protein [Dyadobacter sp. UC 10]KAA0989580.1 hypothetical protein FXO21_05070 [Dyadobacter sp. UC 10]
MKTLIVLFGLLAWIGCHDEDKIPSEQILEADATWTNMLAADGCSWHFSIKSADSTYSVLPDKGSIQKIEDELGEINSYYSFTPVHLKYSQTGNKSSVKCGWERNATFDEIKVISIRKK